MRTAHLPPHRTPSNSIAGTRLTTAVCGLAGLSLALTLSGCGGSATETSTATAAPATTTSATRATAAQLNVEDAWVKTADTGMTAVFGQLRNTGGSAITISSATTSASARAELHEVVMVGGAMTMQPKKGGFVIKAGSTYALAPGGNHIMVMGLKTPVRPGDTVDVTLSLADGSTVAFSALGKASSGGNEKYESEKEEKAEKTEKTEKSEMPEMESPTSKSSPSTAQ